MMRDDMSLFFIIYSVMLCQIGHAPLTHDTSPIGDPSVLPTQTHTTASLLYQIVQLSRKSVLVPVFTGIGILVERILDIPNVLDRFLGSLSISAICQVSGSVISVSVRL
jgi:hypothetical protein